MPRRNADTREEIREVALDLFAQKGFEQTSLREIAERLDITKAALYYHFPSKDELLVQLVAPLATDLAAFTAVLEERRPDGERAILEDYFDLCERHRRVFQGLLRDTSALARTGSLLQVLHNRDRIDRLLVGSDDPAERARAVVALGGLQDCAVLMADAAPAAYRRAAVDAALRALLPA
ncbi:TetR family transcriptional regulator [Pseudonocardia sp. CNS-139]|nr:TetR family transcriptional regulator [Pseudonocardia sp. CNS-139]